jgi:hypothetical protein
MGTFGGSGFLAVCNANKRWDIAAQVQQRAHFNGSLVPPAISGSDERLKMQGRPRLNSELP